MADCCSGLDMKCPHRLVCLRLGPQLVVLFWKLVDVLVVGAPLEKWITGYVSWEGKPCPGPLWPFSLFPGHHEVNSLTSQCSSSLQAHRDGAKKPLSKTSETVSLTKSSLL
jgi:hypothetical protein